MRIVFGEERVVRWIGPQLAPPRVHEHAVARQNATVLKALGAQHAADVSGRDDLAGIEPSSPIRNGIQHDGCRHDRRRLVHAKLLKRCAG